MNTRILIKKLHVFWMTDLKLSEAQQRISLVKYFLSYNLLATGQLGSSEKIYNMRKNIYLN